MTREELDSLTLMIQDLRMAMDIRDDIEGGTIRPIAQFADGEKIVLSVPQEVKDQIDSKITELSTMLKEKVDKLNVDSDLLR